ncbi:MAG: hypothetical protein VB078_09880 [Clostridiaceae bacterium]|nr:hypothetical protein [Clostridiaceae bacterium]
MKKFEFSLQRILDYDTFLQDRETETLNIMKSEYNKVELAMKQMRKKLADSIEEYQQLCAKGVQAKKAALAMLIIEAQKRLIKEYEHELADRQKKIEKQVEKLVSITQDKLTVEKLRDSSYASYSEEMRKSEEMLIEEYVAGEAARSEGT